MKYSDFFAKISIVLICLACVYARADVIDDLQPGHWAAISLNTIEDVNPCPSEAGCSWSASEGLSAVVDDWNGGAFATRFSNRGGLVVFGGGHGGYYGNEIYVFDLDTRLWVRVSDPVPNPVCNQQRGELQDGSPCSAHTYDYVEYHPSSNSFILLGSASNHDQGAGGSSVVHMFSFDTRTWRALSGENYPNFIGHTGASSAFDPNRDVFWLLPPYNRPFMKFDPNANGGAGLWTAHKEYNLQIDNLSAIDPDRDLFVTLESTTTHTVRVHDLSNPFAGGIQINTIGDTTLATSQRSGFEWDPVVKKFVGWHSGPAVYTLTPPSGDWRTGAWVWQRVDPAPDNTVVPSAPNATGTYSRWRYAPTVNAYVVVNRTNDAVYMYKLSDGAGEPAPDPPDDLTAD